MWPRKRSTGQKCCSEISGKGGDAVRATPEGGSGASDPGFWGISRDVPGIEKRFWCPPNSDLISLQVASPRINFRTKEVTGPFPSNPSRSEG